MKLIFKKFQNLFPKPKGGVLLGNIKGPFKRKEELTEEQLNHHVHIVGASGYGKTVLLSHILSERMKQGKGLMLIDLKGDLDTLNKLTNAVVEANRLQDLKIFSLTDQKFSTPYNLLSRGTANQLRDRILLSLNWSEEYYKNQASSFVLKLLIILCWLRDEGKLGLHIGHVLECAQSKERIQYYGNMVPIENIKIRALAHELAIFLNEKDNYQSLQGLRSQLESITLSDFGELVTSVESGIDLYDSVNQGKIIFLFLDSRRYGETAKTMGRFILQDLKATSAKVDAEVLLENRKPFTVVVDEFADLASEDFIGFLDRARSSKMSIIVAHQEICDLQRISPEFAGRLMGNTSTLYAFLQKRPESAEIISGMAGTRKTWKETYQSQKFLGIDIPTGAKSLREVEEFIIHPNIIKSLGVGKCVCIKKYPKATAHLVNITKPRNI